MEYFDRSLRDATSLSVRRIVRTIPTPPNVVVGNYYTGSFRPGYFLDSLRAYVYTHKGFPVSLSHLMGHREDLHNPIVHQEGHAPWTSGYDSSVDWHTFGWPIGGILQTPIRGELKERFLREHRTYHIKDHGTALSLAAGTDILTETPSLMSFLSGVRSISSTAILNSVTLGQHPTYGHLVYTPGAGSRTTIWSKAYDIASVAESLRSFAPRGYWRGMTVQSGVTHNNLWYQYQDFDERCDYGSYQGTLTYLFKNKSWYNNYAKLCAVDTYKVTLQLWSELTELQGRWNGFKKHELSNLVFWGLTFRYEPLSLENHIDDFPAGFDEYWPRQAGVVDEDPTVKSTLSVHHDFRTIPPTASWGHENAMSVPLRSKKHKKTWMGELRTWEERNRRDLERTFLYSSANAIEKLGQGANFFETLPELPGLLGTVSVTANLVREAGMVLRGRADRIGPFARALAGEYLAYTYGFKPLPSDVESLGRAVDAELRAKLTSQSELRGSFRYEFGPFDKAPELGTGSLIVESHSKVTLTGLSSLSLSLLGMEQSGFGLKLSNFWDLVPFSFVVDWFTGFSRRFQDIDSYMLLLACRPAWFVHSYKLSYTPSAAELLDSGVSSGSTVKWTIYRRHVSRLIPPLSDPDIDFRAPRTFNKFADLLSLLIAAKK